MLMHRSPVAQPVAPPLGAPLGEPPSAPPMPRKPRGLRSGSSDAVSFRKGTLARQLRTRALVMNCLLNAVLGPRGDERVKVVLARRPPLVILQAPDVLDEHLAQALLSLGLA